MENKEGIGGREKNNDGEKGRKKKRVNGDIRRGAGGKRIGVKCEKSE